MEIRVRRSTLICIIIILIMIMVVAILGYEFYSTKKNNEEQIQNLQSKINEIEKNNNTLENNIENTSISNTNSKTTKEDEKINLNNDEINEITEYINKAENNAFAECEYSNINDINYSLIIEGAVISEKYECETPVKRYEELSGNVGYDGAIYKFTYEDVKKLFEDKIGKVPTNLENILKEMNLVYDSQNKVYYLATGEYYGVQILVKDGYKKGNTYVVNGKYETPLYNEQGEEVNTFTLTLEKDGENYKFVSNLMK